MLPAGEFLSERNIHPEDEAAPEMITGEDSRMTYTKLYAEHEAGEDIRFDIGFDGDREG